MVWIMLLFYFYAKICEIVMMGISIRQIEKWER